jgi:hypothetical protein
MSIQGTLNTTLYSALTTGGTVTTAGSAAYYMLAKDGAALPYILWDYVNEGDDNDNPHRAKNVVVSIRAYAASSAVASSIDSQIDGALHNKVLSVTGWTNFQTRRENGMSSVEVDASGRKTFMAGADYRIRADK